MGLVDTLKSGGVKKALQNHIDIDENEQVQALCNAFATMEQNRRERQREHFEALGVDVEPPELSSRTERVEQLTALIEARVAGDPWEFWTGYLAPEELENVERAERYAGMDADAWTSKLSTWAGVYRDRLEDGAEMSERELAGYYVRATFGVSLERFEEIVVEWEPGRVLEEGVAGPTQAMDAALEEATAEVRDGE